MKKHLLFKRQHIDGECRKPIRVGEKLKNNQMKVIKLFSKIYVASILFVSCKSGLLISETKVPFEKICGSNAAYKCRATGFGDNQPTFRLFEKERPSADGKTSGNNMFHLGRAADINVWNNTVEALELNKSDFTVDTVKVNYDLKNDNVSKILAELNSTLKNEKVSLDISAQIKDSFQRKLDNDLVIEAYLITYTINLNVIDEIRKAQSGETTESRFKIAAESLIKEGNKPLVREVKVILEICKFNETISLSNLLEPILKIKLGNENPKVNAVLQATLSKQKSFTFASNYKRISLYSYGYFNDKWMFKTN
jgi:hypothetical protein